ncbi:methylsterol monooxygenase 1-1-like [Andrographis paniculata]|uniref:methylsterol monooxygenase 1-1-like n=1 Tax=Andrographis paniculata TaxID=175694 RepID=UPI0021E7425F|nr:methylsterol monooxygenase 1-1-like [Andrographis paniculata]
MLPFETIQEAKLFLGRNLTYGEILWFEYSARKFDYFLYCHNTIFLFVFYSLLPLPYMALELARSTKIDRFKIQPKVSNTLNEMVKCYKKVMFTFVFAVVPLQIFSYPLVKMIGIRTSLPLPTAAEMAAQLAVYFLAEDYANYWLHRMLHTKWGFDHVHYLHHEYTAPMGLAAPYAHWCEIIVLGLASFVGPAIAPGHMITFWLWMILRQMEAIDTHSGYDFPWNPLKLVPFYGGADFHDYHHFVGRSCQSNFASIFTYCDYIYGTDKGYRYQKEITKKIRNKDKEQ